MKVTKSVLLAVATMGVGVVCLTSSNTHAATKVIPIPRVLQGSWVGTYQHRPFMYKLTKYKVKVQSGLTVNGHWKSKPMTFYVKTAQSTVSHSKYSLFTVSKQTNKRGYWKLRLLNSRDNLYFKPVKHNGKAALYKYHIDKEYSTPKLDNGYFYRK